MSFKYFVIVISACLKPFASQTDDAKKEPLRQPDWSRAIQFEAYQNFICPENGYIIIDAMTWNGGGLVEGA